MGKMIGYQRPDGQSVNGYTSNEMAVFAMTRGKRMFWVSFALLGAAALGAGAGSAGKRVPAFAIGAAHASEPGARHAKPGGGETTDGWVYLGRRSADGWKPPSPSISRPRFPVKPGDRLVVKRDALVYGSVDCKVIDAADFKPDGTRRSVLLVRADREGLEIAGPAVAWPLDRRRENALGERQDSGWPACQRGKVIALILRTQGGAVRSMHRMNEEVA